MTITTKIIGCNHKYQIAIKRDVDELTPDTLKKHVTIAQLCVGCNKVTYTDEANAAERAELRKTTILKLRARISRQERQRVNYAVKYGHQ